MRKEHSKQGDSGQTRVSEEPGSEHRQAPSAAKPASPGIRPLIESQPAPMPVQRRSLVSRLPQREVPEGPLEDWTNAVFRPDIYKQPVLRKSRPERDRADAEQVVLTAGIGPAMPAMPEDMEQRKAETQTSLPAAKAPIQRQADPKAKPKGDFVPRQVILTKEVDQEEFKQIALSSLFGQNPPTNLKWTLHQDRYGPEDSPVTILVDVSLLKSIRSEANKGKGYDVEAGGGIEGAKERAEQILSGDDPKIKQDLFDEIDRRYYESTGIPGGEKIKNTEADKGKKEYWNQIRDEVFAEHEYLRNLPEQVKKLIQFSTNGKPLTARDYEQLFRIAKKIEGMDAGQVNDYFSKINRSTMDLSEFEASINRYIVEMAEREKAAEERESIKTKLHGLEDVYRQYLDYKQGGTLPMRDEFGVVDPNAVQERIDKLSALEANLKRHNFASIADFEAYIHKFENAFRKEAQNIALDILAKYEDLLFKEGERYKDPSELAALHQKLEGFRGQYQEFKKNASIANTYARDAEVSRLPGNGHLRPTITQDEAKQAHANAAAAKEEASQEVQRLSGDYPIFQESHLPVEKRIDKEKMATAETSNLGSLIQSHISARIKDVHEAKGHIFNDSELVYKMDSLMPEFYSRQGIEKDSIYDLIIKESIRANHSDAMIIGLVLGVLAIALSVISLGAATPVIAAAAAGGALALGAYSVYDEYHKYTSQNALADVGFADDPSMVWLIVAVVGVAFDMGAAVKAVKSLGPAAKALNAGGSVADFQKAVQVLEQAGQIDAKISKAAQEAAAARQAFSEAQGDLAKILGSKLYSFPGPFTDPDVYKQLVKMAGLKMQEGIATFKAFALELEKARKLAGLKEMTPEELTRAKAAWEEARAGKAAKEAILPKLSREAKLAVEALPDDQLAKITKLHDESPDAVDGILRGYYHKVVKEGGDVSEAAKYVDDSLSFMKITQSRGFPYGFDSLRAFEEFKARIVSTLQRYGLPYDDVAVHGSSVIRNTPNDIDIAVMVDKSKFDEIVRGIQASTDKVKIREQLLTEAAKGKIPSFLFERKFPGSSFGQEIYGSAGKMKVQVSIIQKGGAFDIEPYIKF